MPIKSKKRLMKPVIFNKHKEADIYMYAHENISNFSEWVKAKIVDEMMVKKIMENESLYTDEVKTIKIIKWDFLNSKNKNKERRA